MTVVHPLLRSKHCLDLRGVLEGLVRVEGTGSHNVAKVCGDTQNVGADVVHVYEGSLQLLAVGELV